MAEVSVLDVLLHGEPIGTLPRVGGDRNLFAFNDSYIKDHQRPVLGLGFKDEIGELITEFKSVQTHVMPYFANLLPQGHLRTYLAEHAGVNPKREFVCFGCSAMTCRVRSLCYLPMGMPGHLMWIAMTMIIKKMIRERMRCAFPLQASRSSSRQSMTPAVD
jgi:HipA-like protein